MSESILDWKWATEGPSSGSQSASVECPAGSGRSRAQDSTEGLQWMSQPKGRKKRIPLPQHQPSRAWSLLSLPQGRWNLFPCIISLALGYFYKFLSLAYSLDPTWKVQKGTNVQFHCFLPRFSTSDGSLGPVTPSLVLLTGLLHTQLLVGTGGTLWKWMEQENYSPKAPGNGWCLM